jgi:hypothetical protein
MENTSPSKTEKQTQKELSKEEKPKYLAKEG